MEVTRAPTLFATHFHELTALAHGDTLGVANYHVAAHIDPSSHKLTMLYKVYLCLAHLCASYFCVNVCKKIFLNCLSFGY